VDQSHGEWADLSKDRPSVTVSRHRGFQCAFAVPEPPAGEFTRDRLVVVAVFQGRPGPLAVTTWAAPPLGEEHLLPRLGASYVAPEEGTQLIRLLDPLVQDVDQPVDRRLTTDPFEQVGTAEGPEPGRVLQERAVLQTGAGLRGQLPTKGCRVLFPGARRYARP